MFVQLRQLLYNLYDRCYRNIRYDRLYPVDSCDRVNSRSGVLPLAEGMLALVLCRDIGRDTISLFRSLFLET